jgi:hypothetical protein
MISLGQTESANNVKQKVWNKPVINKAALNESEFYSFIPDFYLTCCASFVEWSEALIRIVSGDEISESNRRQRDEAIVQGVLGWF